MRDNNDFRNEKFDRSSTKSKKLDIQHFPFCVIWLKF